MPAFERASAFDADVAVVGSGIVGTLTALALQDEGLSVVVVEQHEPGAGTAAGSGGYIHDGEIFPVANLALLAALPRMLFDPLGPLVFRPSYLPRMTGWGVRFLRSMRGAAIQRGIAALASLNRLAVDTLFAAARAAGAEDLLVHAGGLKVARSRRAFDGFAHELALLSSAGIPARVLDRAALAVLEPALGDRNAGAIFFPKSSHCLDPERFGEALAAHVRERGNTVRARAESLQPQGDGTWAIRVRNGRPADVRARRVVVSAGYTSPELLQPLGYRAPIAPARGYHLMIEHPGVALEHPIIFHEPHVGATPMRGGLRLAGTMEFALPDAPPDYRRATMLYGIVREYVPGLQNDRATTWMGIRPSAPDSLPSIGRAIRHPNLYYCFGHGHLGFTQAAISARCVADLITDRPPPIDLAPFDLARF